MSISLSRELEKRIQERVEAGLAPSVQEFVEGAVRDALSPEGRLPQIERRKSAAGLFDEVWGDVSAEALEKLPKDGAQQVDHYIYGTPKR